MSRWSSLVDPQQPIPSFIQQLTGITNAMVRGAPTFDAIAPALYERLNGKLFVAHNASFDRGFLRGEFRRAGFAFDPDVLCTVRLSRALFPAEKRHGLDALVERHGRPVRSPPRARRRRSDLAVLATTARRSRATRMFCRPRSSGPPGATGLPATSLKICSIPRRPDAASTCLWRRRSAAYVGRSVRVRQRLRSHLTGERRSSKDMRLAQQVRRVEWRAKGGELGAMLAEAQWIATLRPGHNRVPRVTKSDPPMRPGVRRSDRIRGA